MRRTLITTAAVLGLLALFPLRADAARIRWDLAPGATNTVYMLIDVYGLGGLVSQFEGQLSSLDPALGGSTAGGYGDLTTDGTDGTLVFDAQLVDPFGTGFFLATSGFRGSPLTWTTGPVGVFLGTEPLRMYQTADFASGFTNTIAGLTAFGPTGALGVSGINFQAAVQNILNPVFDSTQAFEFVTPFGGGGISPPSGFGTFTMLNATDFVISDLVSIFAFTTTFMTLGAPILTTVSALMTLNLVGSIVPEPSSLVLLGAGIFALAAYRRFRAS